MTNNSLVGNAYQEYDLAICSCWILKDFYGNILHVPLTPSGILFFFSLLHQTIATYPNSFDIHYLVTLLSYKMMNILCISLWKQTELTLESYLEIFLIGIFHVVRPVCLPYFKIAELTAKLFVYFCV